LHQHGVRLAIDDFGTGYSSLGYLRNLPVDEVKVDKSFVKGMGDAATASPKDAAIVRSVTAMAHELSLEVVAEGVEHQHLWDTVVGLGCDVMQGYFISRPLLPADLERWIGEAPAQPSPRLPSKGTDAAMPALLHPGTCLVDFLNRLE
jgi:EAL domain-containing protein (putative c-di-GMP-specific phosphodiesterase class I)